MALLKPAGQNDDYKLYWEETSSGRTLVMVPIPNQARSNDSLSILRAHTREYGVHDAAKFSKAVEFLKRAIDFREKYKEGDIKEICLSIATLYDGHRISACQANKTINAFYYLPSSSAFQKDSNRYLFHSFLTIVPKTIMDSADQQSVRIAVFGHFRTIEHVYAYEGHAGGYTILARSQMVRALNRLAGQESNLGHLATHIPKAPKTASDLETLSEAERYSLHSIIATIDAINARTNTAKPFERLARAVELSFVSPPAGIQEEIGRAVAKLRGAAPKPDVLSAADQPHT